MTYSAPKAFTLIELLIVVSIISVLTGIMIPGFSTYIRNQNIKQSQEQIKNDLRGMQNSAITGVMEQNVEVTYWGLCFQPATSDKKYSVMYSTSDISSAVFQDFGDMLPGEVVLKNSSNICIYFSAIDGNAHLSDSNSCSDTGTNCTLLVGEESDTTCRGVRVNSVGRISKVDGLSC